MRKAVGSFSVCGACVALVALLSGCGGSSGSAVVAWVEGVSVTSVALEHWTSVEKARNSALGLAAARETALDLLIAAQWTLREARVLGVGTNDGEVDRQLSVVRYDRSEGVAYGPLPAASEFVDTLGNVKETSADERWLMALNLLALKVEAKLTLRAQREIPRARIVRFYLQHRRRFFLPERRHLEVLASYDKTVIDKARHEIESGTDFLAVARRMSVDSEAPGALQSHLARGEEEPEYDRVVFAAKQGVLVGPVKQVFYFLFRVLAIVPAHFQKLRQSEAVIRRQIATKEHRSTRLLKAAERQWLARTTCRAGYAALRCGQSTTHVRVRTS